MRPSISFTLALSLALAGCNQDTPPGPCTLFPQSGCPAGQACDLVGESNLLTATPSCRPVTIPGQEGDLCSDLTECAPGLFCIGAGGTASYCLKYCSGDGQCHLPGGKCIIRAFAIDSSAPDGGGGAGPTDLGVEHQDMEAPSAPGVLLCSLDCDPITAHGCPAGWGCRVAWWADAYPRADQFSYCDSRGGGGQGDPCTHTQQCQPGFYCAELNYMGMTRTQCLRYCDTADPVGCASLPGAMCYPFDSPQQIGSTTYGLCFAP